MKLDSRLLAEGTVGDNARSKSNVSGEDNWLELLRAPLEFIGVERGWVVAVKDTFIRPRNLIAVVNDRHPSSSGSAAEPPQSLRRSEN